MALPKKGVGYVFYLGLQNASDPSQFKVNPTIAAGDFKISKDGGAFVNLTNTPIVWPAGSNTVRITLTDTEMNADKVSISGIDVSGMEWIEVLATLDIPTGNIEAAVDILEGDHIESNESLVINKKGTTTPVLNKQIKGSLLQPDIEIRTEEAP